nr:putative ribonuclease H-like domain-containing protein [Tanacetum cinerariifolium]
RVEENLHVEFLENKAIEKGAGPNWLFDIDSLTKSMNYVLVDAYTNSTNLSGIKDATNQEVKKDVSSLRYIALPNWVHDALLESSLSKPQDGCSPEVPEGSGNTNPTASTTNPPPDQIETLTVETSIPTVSLPVPTACLNDSPEPSSDARLISKRVANQEETPSLDNILSLTNRFEDILGVESILDEAIGVEADINNMETTITASPTPTLRIHKDHPKKSDLLGQNRFSRIRRMKEGLLSEIRPGYWLKGTHRRKGLTMMKSSNPQLCREFEALMHAKFQMSAMGELNFFLGLQVLQKKDGIFLSQGKYVRDILKKFGHQVTPKECHLHAVKRIVRYLKGHPKLGLWYPKESPFDLVAYSDSDYGGATQDHKSTTRGSQFLGRRLILWQCKKLTIVATSTTEAEYVTAASCCGKVLRI